MVVDKIDNTYQIFPGLVHQSRVIQTQEYMLWLVIAHLRTRERDVAKPTRVDVGNLIIYAIAATMNDITANMNYVGMSHDFPANKLLAAPERTRWWILAICLLSVLKKRGIEPRTCRDALACCPVLK